MTETKGALAGLRVLDFTTLYPGPLATMLLADLGADVVRVDAPDRPDLLRFLPPHGADGQGAVYRTVNRNKRSLQLDLKAPGAAGVVKRLVGTWDIVVEQFRPGVMDRLGIGWQALSAANPRLIYCAISAYGQTGPLTDRPGHDINFLALSGLSSHLGRAGAGPLPLGTLVGDVGGGTWPAVAGILAAVLHRAGTGEGQRIDISMTDGALLMNAMAACAALSAGEDLQPEGSWLNGGGLYDYYRTRDGRYLSVGALEPKFFSQFVQAIGRPDLEEFFMAVGPDAEPLRAAVTEAIASQDLAHWVAVFEASPCCVEPVLTPSEATGSALFAAREMVVDVPLPEGGAQAQPGNPIRLSACPPRYDHASVQPGSDTESVLTEAGLTAEEIKAVLLGQAR